MYIGYYILRHFWKLMLTIFVAFYWREVCRTIYYLFQVKKKCFNNFCTPLVVVLKSLYAFSDKHHTDYLLKALSREKKKRSDSVL